MTLPAVNHSPSSSGLQPSDPVEVASPPPIPAVIEVKHPIELPLAPAHSEVQAPALATLQASPAQVQEAPREAEFHSSPSSASSSSIQAQPFDRDPAATTVHVPAGGGAPPREQMDAAQPRLQAHTVLEFGDGSPECQRCAECCAGYGVCTLGISVGLWACGCPGAEVTAMVGGSMVGGAALHGLSREWGCIPDLRTVYR